MFELTKEDFLLMREDGLTFREIGEFYNLTERQVNYRTKSWGLDYSKKKVVDELFFSSGTKAAYYWAGFIAADGYIEEDRNRLGIGLKKSDIKHLEKFKKAIKSQHSICDFMNGTASRIRFNSEQICTDLRTIFNITGNKTYNYEVPIIKDTYLLLEYLRGFIDGDGHYEVRPSKSVYLSICAHSKIVLKDIKRYFEQLLGRSIIKEPIYHESKTSEGSWYSLTLVTRDSEDLIKYLYRNSTESTRLSRKYSQIKHILKDNGIVH